VRGLAIDGYHIPPARIRVAHNGIRLERLRSVPADARLRTRRALEIAPESPVIALIARLYPEKGARSMLAMMSEIAKSCPDVILLVAGDGPERTACEQLTQTLELGRVVRFLGNRDDVPELLAASDLLVVPSASEGLGFSAIEALAAGRPVVAFDVGGLSEIVSDGANGRLIPAGDQRAFVDAVVTLLRDRPLLKAFGERAAHDSERFSLERHVETLLQCYREADSASAD
jgi:glycosyltransferase involved in cell wall biosynthesis